MDNQEVKLKESKTEYFQSLSESLKNKLSIIINCSFNDRYQIDVQTARVLNMLEYAKENHYCKDLIGDISLSIDEIKHTENKEVRELLQLKEKDSQKQKVIALNAAKRQLDYFINDIIRKFEKNLTQ